MGGTVVAASVVVDGLGVAMALHCVPDHESAQAVPGGDELSVRGEVQGSKTRFLEGIRPSLCGEDPGAGKRPFEFGRVGQGAVTGRGGGDRLFLRPQDSGRTGHATAQCRTGPDQGRGFFQLRKMLR